MFQRIIKNFAWAVAALTLVWLIAKTIYGVYGLAVIPQYGYSGTSVTTAALKQQGIQIKFNGKSTVKDAEGLAAALQDSVLVFASVSSLDFEGSARPAKRDTLLTVKGLPATTALWKAEAERPHPIGYRVPFTYSDSGKVKSATLVLPPFPKDRLAVLWIFLGLSALVGLLYFGIGLFTLYKQGGTEQARVLALLTLALCMMVMNVLPPIIQGIAEHNTPDNEWGANIFRVIGVLATFGTAYWLHLAFAFPFSSPTLANHPIRAYLLCYVPPVLALPAKLLGTEITDGTIFSWLSGLGGLAMFIQFIAGIVILRRKRKRTSNSLERRQLNAVFLGSMLGPVVLIVPVIILGLIAALWGGDHEIPDTLIIGGFLFFFCLAFLPIPISLLYAFRKYRMMEVELRLRRGTRFAATTGGVLLVFFVLLYGISSLLLNTFSLHSGTAALAAGLVLALSFAPVQRRTQRMVEQRFFPERKRLRAMLDHVLASASTMPDRAALWDSLQSGLKQGLGMAAAISVLWDERSKTFRLPDGAVVPVRQDGAFFSELLNSPRPLLVDELISGGRIPLTEAESQWLRTRRASVLLPMVIHTRLTGFLVLAFAPEQEDIAAEDLNVLASVVSQVALQSENLRLIEENLEKHRLQEQLAMARDVQQRFLPQTMPETPGLDVAACFRSSLEVAGDYYDVVPLSGGRTLMAVGDVAGKGAGAAMIMANVQAALRSMAHAAVPLAAIVSGVNDLLCVNTTPEQFVTFFAAIYDPGKQSFTCINAGHNPPRIVRSDGSISLLQAGGFCLGVFPGTEYEEEVVPVGSGDLLIAFTDGVCEAMNSAEEEFGEERIADLCVPLRAQNATSLLTAIEESVIAFHGSASFTDDFTLLLVKAL